jgi:hypothetical protein
MKRKHLITGFVALACAMLVTRADASVAGASSAALDASRFSATVDHPLVALSSVRVKVFKGRERDPQTGESVAIRGEARVLAKTTRVAGVRVAVVEVKEFEGGELVERTRDYFAQRDDGSVWYFGEKVDDYEDGKVVGHDGQWFAGRNGARPGLYMPAGVRVGQTFEQERAPGVAEDRSTVVAVGQTVKTAAGTFRNCIKTRDVAPLDKKTESKFYCRGVGLVREQSKTVLNDLARYTKR